MNDMSGYHLEMDLLHARRHQVAQELQEARTNVQQIHEQQQHAQAQIKEQQQLLQQRTQQMQQQQQLFRQQQQQQQQQQRPQQQQQQPQQPQPAPKYVPVTGASSMRNPPPASNPGSEKTPTSSGAPLVHAPVTRPTSSANASGDGGPVTRPVSSAPVSVEGDPLTSPILSADGALHSDPVRRPVSSGDLAAGVAPAANTGPALAAQPRAPKALQQQRQRQQQQQQREGHTSRAPLFAGAQAPHAPPATMHAPQRMREHQPLGQGPAGGAAPAPPQTQAAAHAARHAMPPQAPPSPAAAAPPPPTHPQRRYMPPLGPAPEIIPTAATGAAGAPHTAASQTQAAQASPSYQAHIPFIGLAEVAPPPTTPPQQQQQQQQQQQHFGTSRTLVDGMEGGPASRSGAPGVKRHGKGSGGGAGPPASTVQQLQRHLEQAGSERRYQPHVLQHQHQRQQQPDPMAAAAHAAASSAVSRPNRKERRQQLQQQQQQQQPQHPSPPQFPTPLGPRSEGSSDAGSTAGAAAAHALHSRPATAKPPKKARPPKNKLKTGGHVDEEGRSAGPLADAAAPPPLFTGLAMLAPSHSTSS
ncbi:hypothetical protein DUNSADRAFT_13815 [Dunaliella salina]|uniref:Uncharacterized protein n=1 Tax=Dunaliella salina TaxID=3046 RepID=A0ABQ7G8P7_DUNSA|nr:hypothetical protein DUNSADRAFT_13815 [Dunaliella salina]|eukprot:KAF5830958.1 hypothetical protein DUNSADRAFT_13815 [Dunaliella salina]